MGLGGEPEPGSALNCVTWARPLTWPCLSSLLDKLGLMMTALPLSLWLSAALMWGATGPFSTWGKLAGMLHFPLRASVSSCIKRGHSPQLMAVCGNSLACRVMWCSLGQGLSSFLSMLPCAPPHRQGTLVPAPVLQVAKKARPAPPPLSQVSGPTSP